MFDGISGGYDRLNRLITFGIDRRWRKKLMRLVQEIQPGRILDIATGTGDLLLLAARMTSSGEITGADISEGMLEIAKKKINASPWKKRIKLQVADAESLPYSDGYFDAITVAFGVRNFEDLDKGLTELLRVLRPGGRLVVLETSVPGNPIIRRLYHLHSEVLLPLMGKLFSRDAKAYKYLSESAKKFPYGEDFNNKLRENGFIQVKHHPLTMGAASIYVAEKA
jgi:demethylmenaquinone methyltransferase/2-methoxy-6-polyprenyl-1,4-benzoquinol methylase